MNHELELAISAEISRLLAQDLGYNAVAKHLNVFLLDLSKRQKIPPLQIVDQIIYHQRQSGIHAENQVLEFLKLYRVSWIRKRRIGTSQQIKEASGGKVKFDSSTLNEVALTQNRARGKTFEQMGSVLVEYYLRQIENYSGPITISADRTVFESFDSQNRPSKRRYDLYLMELKVGVEIKSGYITYQRSIRDQIYKDHYLLMNNVVSDVWWFLFYGASQKVLLELIHRNINFIDLGLNDFEEI
jgi:hypothetical protein